MTTKRNKSWRRLSAGTTLIEAVAGVVILGTILVMIVMAKTQLDKKSLQAQGRLQACRVMDDLLDRWWSDDLAKFPRNGAGDVPDWNGWKWQTRAVTRADAKAVHAEVVVVDVFAPGFRDMTPGATVELMLPAPIVK